MRIAIVSDYYAPSLGGVSEHVDGQARALVARGHDVTVVTGTPVRPPPIADADRPGPPPTFDVVRVGAAVPAYANAGQTLHTLGPRLTARLRALLRARAVDVVHVHAPYNPWMPAQALLAAPAGAACVGTFHSVFPRTRAMALHARLIRRAVARLDARVCVSVPCVDSVAPYFPGPYEVIPNGVDTAHFTPAAAPAATVGRDLPTVVFVGRFDPRNGLGTALDAFAGLVAARGPARLVVVGDGPLRRAVARRVPAAVAPLVHFAGRLDRTRPDHLVAGDVFVSPCRRASFGLALLEAMSCGLPVVASRISGFQLLVEDGRHGVLVDDARDAPAFARALAAVLDDPARGRAMGGEGRRTALRRYAWPLVGARLDALYRRLLAGGLEPWRAVASPAAP